MSSQGFNYKTVSATSKAEINTMFLGMVMGIDSLSVPAIRRRPTNPLSRHGNRALVLDNSGSMGENNNARLRPC